MDSWILFEQLMVLVALMATGFIAYRTKLIDDNTYSHLSSLMVWILNPFLMISGVIGKTADISGQMVLENIAMVGILYGSFFLIGFVYIFLMRLKGNETYLYRFVMLFPNVGFMGVPLVRQMLGAEYIVYVAFYLLAFNLIVYSYGIHLASRIGGNREKLRFRKMISPGTITAILAILIFALKLDLPAPVVSYVDFMGNTSITVSMLIIGVFIARLDFRTAFSKKDYYIFTVAKMFLVPFLLICLCKILPFDEKVEGVFQILCCMPVASLTCMMSQEYASDGTECAKLIAISTIVTVVSAPVVIFLGT